MIKAKGYNVLELNDLLIAEEEYADILTAASSVAGDNGVFHIGAYEFTNEETDLLNSKLHTDANLNEIKTALTNPKIGEIVFGNQHFRRLSDNFTVLISGYDSDATLTYIINVGIYYDAEFDKSFVVFYGILG